MVSYKFEGIEPKIVRNWLRNKQFIFIKTGMKAVVNYLEGI